MTLKENLRSGKTSVTFEQNKINYWQKDCKSYVKTESYRPSPIL